MEQLTELIGQLLVSNAEDKAAAAARQNELLAQLMAARAPDPAVVRADKLSKLGAALRKSTKLREYKEDIDCSVKEWIRRLEHEVTALKKMHGIEDDLERAESIEIFRDRLDYTVIKRLDTAFATKDPVWTWDDVTWEQLKTILKEEYGPKVAQVGEVLLQFGPGRLKKTDEMTVASFTYQW